MPSPAGAGPCPMIQLSALSKSFGDRVLLDNVTWQINARERVGLCGPNGAGKTTLLRMMAGLDEADTGLVVKPAAMTVGYLPQDGLEHSGRSLIDEVRTAFQPLLDLKHELHGLEERLADPSVPESEHEALLVRYAEAQEEFRHRDGYSIDLKAATVLRGLGFADEDADKPTETFSGGWQMRIALAKLLLGDHGLLLLDEPTNHLDLDARNWLEDFLNEYPHAVILVSHDRYFLDAVVTRITEINLKTLTDYTGNYSVYLTQSQERLDRLRQMKKEQDEEIARVKLFIDRFRYKATKAAQVQSRIKALDKIVPIEVPPERKRVHFTFPACPKSGRAVIELKHARKAYGDKVVFRDASLLIERGDRIALIGPNGAGKSTLMRMLSGEEAPDQGTRTPGHEVVMQYFAQDEATRLDPAKTVYEVLSDGSPVHMVPQIRNILGGFLFSGDDVYKKAAVLSGGERTRLAVARMLLRPANTLLLDEPTNHLDLDSKDVLLDALEDFGGTLILVSHDRYFIDKLATKVIEIGHGEAHVFHGNYEDFLYHKQQVAALESRGATTATPPPSARTPRPASAVTPGAGAAKERSTPGGNGRGRVAATAARGGTQGSARGGTQGAVQAASPSDSGNGHERPGASANANGLRPGAMSRDEKKRIEAEERRKKRAREARQKQVAEVENAIAAREAEMKTLEATMAEPGFYENHEASKPVIDRHQALMWELGDLMHRWEELQADV
ncbi:MAG: ATP-binding cassette domain-containing protein [Vicinamibacteraceae bacterium]|nr:ATP-binding cassette domain-containing protein [Vicinamibacteraceae bacterium]